MAEPHPEIFSTVPPQPKEKKPGQLPEHMIKQFFEEGYLVVEDFFEKELLEACRRSIEELVDDLAKRMKNAGKLSSTYEEYGLFERLTWMEKEFPGTNIILHKQGTLTQAFRDVWTNERLLNVIEQLIGPDIMGHPVWNLRTKTPKSEAATVPWHQDASYLDEDSYSVLQPTAWVPLLDANEINGCLEMAKRGHKTGRVAKHHCCAGDTWYVMLDEDEMAKTLEIDLKNDFVKLPVKYGGMILFNNLIPHRSLQNFSEIIRWSLDLRWQTPDKPVGFHGLKEGILFRSSKQPGMTIDWTNSIGHQVTAHKEMSSDQDKEEEFSTTVYGPWMYKWEITHPNRHTASMQQNSSAWHKA